MKNYLKEANDYYETYLGQHSKTWTRRLHVLGNLATIFYFFFILHLGLTWSFWALSLLVFTPIIIYFWAWPSHWLIEGGHPATFKKPWIITKIADWKMMWQILKGDLPS